MAIKEVIDVSKTQTIGGQPIQGNDADNSTTTGASAGDSSAASDVTADVSSDLSKPAAAAQSPGATVDVNIAPEALRQITALSRNNRLLQKQIGELQAKLTSATPQADIDAKLKRLEQLEAEHKEVLESPRKYLERAKKTLDDVAADALNVDNVVNDPRIDQLTLLIAKQNEKLEAIEAARTTETTTQATTQATKVREAHIAGVKDIIGKSPERWELLSADEGAAARALEAAGLVYERDHKDPATGKLKDITQAQAQKILEECLDKAEALALAEEIVKQRQNGSGQESKIPVRSKGIVIREDSPEPRAPRPTIDGNRGPTRTQTVPRGPTDVRTAKARAMAIATGQVQTNGTRKLT